MNHKDYQKLRVLQLMDKIEDLHGQKLMFHLWNRTLKPDKRRLYLKYSICSNSYYLTDRG